MSRSRAGPGEGSPSPSGSRSSIGTYVGLGRGDYVQETRFTYVGEGTDPAANPNEDRGCRGVNACFSNARNRCAGINSRQHRDHIMSNVGTGGGDYVMETAFKYVGSGAGDYTVVEDPEEEEEEPTPDEKPKSSVWDVFSTVCCYRLLLLLALLLVIGLGVASARGKTLEQAQNVLTHQILHLPAQGGQGGSSPPQPGVGKDTPLRLPCETLVLESARAGEDLNWPARSWTISLDHSDWKRYGFMLKSDEHELVVQGVNGGLLGTWNRVEPEKEVRQGDFLINVNGVQSDTQSMLREFNRPEVMEVVVVRTGCDVVTTTTTTTHTSTTPKLQVTQTIPTSTQTTTTQTTTTRTTTSTKTSSTSTITVSATRTTTSTQTTTTPASTTTMIMGPWECYTWTDLEHSMLKTFGETNEAQVCTRDRRDSYSYRFSNADPHAAPGCGLCKCCRKQADATYTTTMYFTETSTSTLPPTTLPAAEAAGLLPWIEEARERAGGLKLDMYYHIPQNARTFSDATQGMQPSSEWFVRTMDFSARSPVWDFLPTTVSMAAKWSGLLIVDEGGGYEFEIASDLSTTLSLNQLQILGGSAIDMPGFSPFVAIANRKNKVLLEQGAHPIEVTMLRPDPESMLSLGVRYRGPDTKGKLVLIPKSALRPADHDEGQGGGSQLQQKFPTLGDRAPVLSRRSVPAKAAGAIFLALGLVAAALPGVSLALLPVREALRSAWQRATSRRDIRRYESLSEILTEEVGGRARPFFEPL